MTRGLSKSRLLAGLQCHRLLWWKVHEPGAEELVPEPEQQRIFDRGTEGGERARDYVPGGVLIESEGGDLGAMVRATQEAMEAGAPVIYEAAFSVDGVYVAVDILQRVDDGWCIIEVKSGTRVKDVHFQDVAVQIHVLERAGMRISGAEVMVLNRDCAAPRLEDLFSRHDVMQEARRHVPSMAMWAKEQIRMLGESNPTVETGGHCSSPYRCPFWDRCHESLPEHHVSSLYAARDRAPQWERQGIRLIEDIPDDVSLSPVQRRQVRAIRAGHMVVEKEPLARELASHPRPWGYLDFETIGLPIPRWDGCHPYDQVPTQFVYYEPHAVLSLSPNTGTAEGGTVVTLSGRHLRDFAPHPVLCRFGTALAVTAHLANDTLLCIAPPAEEAGVAHRMRADFGADSATAAQDIKGLSSLAAFLVPLSAEGLDAVDDSL